jgi:hypothetical protein
MYDWSAPRKFAQNDWTTRTFRSKRPTNAGAEQAYSKKDKSQFDRQAGIESRAGAMAISPVLCWHEATGAVATSRGGGELRPNDERGSRGRTKPATLESGTGCVCEATGDRVRRGLRIAAAVKAADQNFGLNLTLPSRSGCGLSARFAHNECRTRSPAYSAAALPVISSRCYCASTPSADRISQAVKPSRPRGTIESSSARNLRPS